MVVIQTYEEQIIRQECTINEWIREVINWHGEVVDLYLLVDIQLTS